MNATQQAKIDRLNEIMEELSQLGHEASGLIQKLDSQAHASGMAYDAFSFGCSSNRYNTTLASIVDGIAKKLDGDPEDEDDLADEEEAYSRKMGGA